VTTPRTIWSAWRGSTPRFIATSTVSSNFAVATALIRATASSTERLALPANQIAGGAGAFADAWP
jgi:hypothetical protein